MFNTPATLPDTDADASTLGHLDSETLYRLAAYFEATARQVKAWAHTAKTREADSLLHGNRISERLCAIMAVAQQLAAKRVTKDEAQALSGFNRRELDAALKVLRSRKKKEARQRGIMVERLKRQRGQSSSAAGKTLG